MTVSCPRLRPGEAPPDICGVPFRAVLVIESGVTDAWRSRISDWVVQNGCLYAKTWGVDCSQWHNSVDFSLLRVFDLGEVPDESRVMTTWHDAQLV